MPGRDRRRCVGAAPLRIGMAAHSEASGPGVALAFSPEAVVYETRATAGTFGCAKPASWPGVSTLRPYAQGRWACWSGKSPGIQRPAWRAGKARVSGARVVSDDSAPVSRRAEVTRRAVRSLVPRRVWTSPRSI